MGVYKWFTCCCFCFINHGQVDNFQIIINSEGELIDDPRIVPFGDGPDGCGQIFSTIENYVTPVGLRYIISNNFGTSNTRSNIFIVFYEMH